MTNESESKWLSLGWKIGSFIMAKKSDTNVQFDAATQSAAMSVREVEPTTERDEFASPDFVDPDARLPRIQAVRGESNLEHCGYFITADNMAQAGWLDFD